MTRILLTGFSPFDKREYNASWLAVKALAAEDHSPVYLRALEIPVCWGVPRKTLEPVLQQWKPQHIIALGEGPPGVFKVETKARNQRKEREDNNGLLPAGEPILPGGPHSMNASADCAALQEALSSEGIPIVLSQDAGAYLCEELLYTLEMLKQTDLGLESVVFVHVPPYGTELIYKGEQRNCDEALLLDFARSLLSKVMP